MNLFSQEPAGNVIFEFYALLPLNVKYLKMASFFWKAYTCVMNLFSQEPAGSVIFEFYALLPLNVSNNSISYPVSVETPRKAQWDVHWHLFQKIDPPT